MKNEVPEHKRRKTLYLSTEGPFPVGRLRQMIEGMGESRSLMDNIFIENITCIVRMRKMFYFFRGKLLCFRRYKFFRSFVQNKI